MFNMRPLEGSDRLGDLVTLGVNSGKVSEENIVKKGIWIYALYRTMCTLHHNPLQCQNEVVEMMKQYAREAARGHTGATHTLEGIWSRDQHSQRRFEALLETIADDIA